MLLGIYSTYLNGISTLSFNILIPMGIGLIIGGFIFMVITKFLLNKFHDVTFSGIIGFTVGSIFVLLPTFSSVTELIIILLCIILGFLISSFFKGK